MVHSLDNLLLRAFQAYRRALTTRPDPPSVRLQVPKRLYANLVFLGSTGWMAPSARLQLRKLNAACDAGLAAARKGKLEESASHYAGAEILLDRLKSLSEKGALIGTSVFEAGVAYLDCRLNRIPSVYVRLDRSMDADLALEREGLPVALLHRIQQGHNLVRVAFRLGQREAAVELAGALVAFLEGQADTLPYHHDWLPASLLALAPPLVREMIEQIASETCCFIVTSETSDKEWQSLIRGSRLLLDPGKARLPQLQHALRAQKALLSQDYELYLTEFESFFSPGLLETPLLWYAMMAEFVVFCRNISTPNSLKIADVLSRDSTKWKGLPPFFEARFQNSPTQVHALA